MLTLLDGHTPGRLRNDAPAVRGFTQLELLLSGEARSYPLVGERRADGVWSTDAGDVKDFMTRVVLRLPDEPDRFSGVVVVEWLNVSGGADMATDWTHLHRCLQREGHAWLGVSAQEVGVRGGGILPGKHLTALDPVRYGTLNHPGDAYAYDIFTLACREVRAWLSDRFPDLTADLRLLATGHSQSAAFLATYINAVDHSARAVDGFLVHGWGGRGAELDGFFVGGRGTDFTLAQRRVTENPNLLRPDLRCPVLLVQSESDRGMFDSTRPFEDDHDLLRVWEIAGAAHADTYMLAAGDQDDGSLDADELFRLLMSTPPRGDVAGGDMLRMFASMLWRRLRSDGVRGVVAMMRDMAQMRSSMPAGTTMNSGPQQHYVLQAACAALDSWVRSGKPPASVSRLATRPDGGFERDSFGIAVGGVRNPWVDAPLAVLTGSGGPMGSTRKLDETELLRRYPNGPDQYRNEFALALDASIAAGHMLVEDRAEALALAAAAGLVAQFTGEVVPAH